ncbi:MAG: hypothetical protein ABI645_10205 [Pseudomonadota bacterium]
MRDSIRGLALAVAAFALPTLPACSADAPKVPPGMVMTNPAPGGAPFAGVNFWNIDWQGQQDYFRKGVNFATESNPWLEELLGDLAPYRVLRFMDWNDTNAGQTTQAHFSTRKQKSAVQNQPVALEWQIDLCNRADKDCWITVHHTSTADDWRSMAALISASLKPSLRLYVEWSNEVWNDGFPVHAYADNAARELGLPGENHAAVYYVYASVRMFEEFSRVFAGQEHRLVKVLAGQAAWTGPCEAQAAAIQDSKVNPRGIRPDVYAIAPYISGESVDQLRRSIAEVRKWTEAQVQCARRLGVPLIAYEGGSDSFSLGDGCARLQQDPAMRQLYTEYLESVTAAGLRGPFMQYTHSGGCWGLKAKTGDLPAVSPKYQGLTDWLARLPATQAR